MVIFSRRYIVYNLGRAVTIVDSTLKGYAKAKETAYLLRYHVLWDVVAFTQWQV